MHPESSAEFKGTVVSKFLAISLPLIFVSTILIFSVFEYYTYTEAQEQLEQELDTILTTQAEALSLPLWNFDTDSIKLTLQAVLANAKVTAIRLRDSDGTVLDEQGDLGSLDADRLVASHEIRRIDATRNRILGSLQIAVTDSAVRDATFWRALVAGVIALILVIAVTVATLHAYYRTVGTPLRLLFGAIQSKRKDGSRIVVDWQSNNEVGAVISAFNDMQAQQEDYERELQEGHELLEERIKERTHELEESRLAAQQATEAKSDFLATMSHEIRTPLNGVVGMTYLLMDTPLNAEQRDLIKVISNSADALLHIINDILDFSKIEAGKLELEHAPFNLRECLEGSLDLVSAAAADKNLTLACIIGDSVPETVIGDGARMRQVLLNLLSNAVKFTSVGEVILTVQNSPTESDGENSDGRLVFSVSDTGMGIPAESQNLLFRSFSQVDVSTTRKHGGTGLGLVICKHLVELMQGAIWLESEYGEGSTFYFTAKLEATNGATALIGSHDLDNVRGRKVLVVESNRTNQQVFRHQLAAWSMQFEICNSAESAMKLIDSDEQFDLCIVDLLLPGNSAISLARRIRKVSPGDALPLIFTSAFGHSTDKRDEIDALGAATVLHKPLKHSALFNTILGALTDKTEQDGRPSTPQLDQTFGIETAASHPLNILLVDDNETNRKLGKMLLQRLGYDIDLVDNGADAIEATNNKAYDLILMDIEMPGMDGFEATRTIRRAHNSDNMRIVAMTANALQGTREQCLDAGMNDYITKPINPDILLQALHSAYEALQQKNDSAEYGGPDNNSSAIDREAISRLLEMIGGAKESLNELICSFLDDAPMLLESLVSGVRENDFDAVKRAAHTLKSSFADFGAAGLAELARNLEACAAANDLNGADPKVLAIRTEYARAASELESIRADTD